MPFTFDGIGTRYVGRKNVYERTDVCAPCKRATKLSSYDTRTWFVVLYVPLVPLARYRIIDQCARCKRHLRMGKKAWETFQDERSQAAAALVRAKPDDPRTAIDAHDILMSAQLETDARALRAAMDTRFARSPDALVFLGRFDQYEGRMVEARRRFEAALALDPNLTSAREALAPILALDGEVDRAVALIKPLIEARTVQSSFAGRTVGVALCKVGRDAEALGIFKATLERFPALGEDSAFAREFAHCESRLGGARTKLAANTRKKRWIGVAAALAGLIAVGVLWADHHAATHMTLHVVSNLDGVKVELPGGNHLNLARGAVNEVELAAGTYQFRVSGTVTRNVEFTLEPHGWPRFLDKTVRVLDATGSAVLQREQAIYSVRGDVPAGAPTFGYGHDFSEWTDIDYAFMAFPRRIELKRGSAPETKTRLLLVDEPLVDTVNALCLEHRGAVGMGLAEWALRGDPTDTALLAAYVEAAKSSKAEARAAGFLASRFDARPVDVDAHLARQDLLPSDADRRALAKRYDELCVREPDEAAWFLLRARLATSNGQRIDLLTHAARGDDDARILVARAAAEASDGEWGAARRDAQRAIELDYDGGIAQELVFDALCAEGRLDEAARMIDALIEVAPCDPGLLVRRVELLAEQGTAADVEAFVHEWETRRGLPCAGTAREQGRWLRARAALVRQDNELALRVCGTTRDRSLDYETLLAYAQSGQMKDLSYRIEGPRAVDVDAYSALAVSLACRVADDEGQASRWEKKARAKLTHGIDLEAAQLLGSAAPDTRQALDIALPPWEKAIFLAVLSCRGQPPGAGPARDATANAGDNQGDSARGELLAASLRLQARSAFPRHIVESLAASVGRR